ncbi:hypothetical protein HH303_07270 [Rhodospirillaceae bacterium KN72]|uniref:Uncharacterized protein n=1 Tax=Pacificispira spongiicola TaxID=2729598 RepID=A0A7Y0HFU9_9PROT|nr:hypothetical protein [Pacificispira spongiicola]NMM44272.1 hypothetical protein [Pacificispira spongiicola]
MTDPQRMKEMMTQMIAQEVRRLAEEADLVVFTLYDPAEPENPIDYQLIDRADVGMVELDMDFDFEGVGLWYLCSRNGDAFSAKKILIQIRNGRFVHGQVGDFEGFWDEFPQYVAEDKWVHSALLKGGANDDGSIPPSFAAAAE